MDTSQFHAKRQQAMGWWHGISDVLKEEFTNEDYDGRDWRTLTGREIQNMYEARNKPDNAEQIQKDKEEGQ